MSYNAIFILVEGNDDELFFREVVTPRLETRYQAVILWKHAKKPAKKIRRFLRSIKAMGADYVYTKDMDSAPCITERKHRVARRIQNVEHDRIAVVVQAIEAWYLAGLDKAGCKRLGLKWLRDTNAVTKKGFNGLVPNRFDSRTDFMWEILKCYALSVAKRRNRSFQHFLRKHSRAS